MTVFGRLAKVLVRAQAAPYTPLAVAAGILPAVEPGVPPGGRPHPGLGRLNYLRVRLKPACWTRRQDAAIYGRRDARRYKKTVRSRRLELKPMDAYQVRAPGARPAAGTNANNGLGDLPLWTDRADVLRLMEPRAGEASASPQRRRLQPGLSQKGLHQQGLLSAP